MILLNGFGGIVFCLQYIHSYPLLFFFDFFFLSLMQVRWKLRLQLEHSFVLSGLISLQIHMSTVSVTSGGFGSGGIGMAFFVVRFVKVAGWVHHGSIFISMPAWDLINF